MPRDDSVADALVRRNAVSEAKATTSVMRAFRAQSGTRGVAGELRVRPRRKVWGCPICRPERGCLTSRAVTPAASPLFSRGGSHPVGPRDACVVFDSERGADRIAAGGLLVWSRDRRCAGW